MKCFKNREEAGLLLASALQRYEDQRDVIILALPRGGVPVAYPISTQLHLPMNVFLVRKLGVPGCEELAMGAIAENNICILNKELLAHLRVSPMQIESTIQVEKKELNRRLSLYRKNHPLPNLSEKTIILIDDGVATGSTLKAATQALRTLNPKVIILAVPVASPSSLQKLSTLADQIVCLMMPEFFHGVGEWYECFDQTTDKEVLDLLGRVCY